MEVLDLYTPLGYIKVSLLRVNISSQSSTL